MLSIFCWGAFHGYRGDNLSGTLSWTGSKRYMRTPRINIDTPERRNKKSKVTSSLVTSLAGFLQHFFDVHSDSNAGGCLMINQSQVAVTTRE